MSSSQVFWSAMGLLASLLAGAVQAQVPAASRAAGNAMPESDLQHAQVTLKAMATCRQEPAALERLDCYDRILAPEQAGFDGALVKARYEGEAWKRAFAQEKQRAENTTALMMTKNAGEHPTVIITAPAIGNIPPRPVLMFSCVDNITRMQVALTQSLAENDIPVTLFTETKQIRSHWFIRENGTLLEASRGLSGIDEIKQLFGAKTLTIETDKKQASVRLTFNINGLEQIIAPLRDACHWAGE